MESVEEIKSIVSGLLFILPLQENFKHTHVRKALNERVPLLTAW
jgi:hypothetical protein